MKLIKLLFAAMMALALVAAQTGNQDDCGFRFHDDGSVDVSRPDGSPRTLQLGEFSINQSNGSLTVNKEGEPDNGATITPPPCGDQGGGQDGGPPTCDVCGYTFASEGDHHGHCDKCDFVFTSDNDQHGHCDQCDYVFSGEGDRHGHCDKCDHIYNSDDDRHGHCDHEGCDFVGNSDADWQNHHHDDGGGDHGDGGGPPPNNHWDGNCGALCSGMGDYYLDSDGDGNAEDGPYATWDHDADGNPVDCGCAGDDGDHDGDEGDHDDQGGQCRYEGCDFVGSTDDDWRGHCDANPDHCRPQAGDTCGYGHDGDEACDYVFTGDEGEDHHHCDTCGVAMSSGQDMDQHCQDNPEHCRPRAGDTCECGFTFAGTDADENHRHCPTCNAQFDNDGDMGQHCQDNEGHCGDNNDQN